MPSRSFLTTLTLLGLLHVLIGWRILPAMPVANSVHWLGGLYLVVSFFLVPAGLLSRSIKRQPLSDRMAWIGLLAMGLFSSLLVLTLLRELVLLAAGLAGVRFDWLIRYSALAVPLLALSISVIGFFNARRVAQVRHVDVPIEGLPDALNGFTIVQISDVHVGPTIKRRYLEAIVERVNAQQPDLIAVTGDLVDGSVQRLAPHTAPLARMHSRYGSFFVTGNHEYYSNAHAWIAEMRRLGLTVLLNRHVIIQHNGASLLVAGVPDYTAHHFDPSHRSDPRVALAGAPRQLRPKILLAHQPRTAPAAADAGYDLQLSGHTHGGQFFPWNFFVPLQQPFVAGLHRLGKLWVYTSRGTGYWGPPKRFFAPSEITRLRLVPAASA